MTDLNERGMGKDVVVVVWGEDGPEPRINEGPGPRALVAIGLRPVRRRRTAHRPGGRRHRRPRARPRTRPYGPQNVLATLYRSLGIDLDVTIPDHTGRPMYLLDDREPIAELL